MVDHVAHTDTEKHGDSDKVALPERVQRVALPVRETTGEPDDDCDCEGDAETDALRETRAVTLPDPDEDTVTDILDEDEGELDRQCVSVGVDVPDTLGTNEAVDSKDPELDLLGTLDGEDKLDGEEL